LTSTIVNFSEPWWAIKESRSLLPKEIKVKRWLQWSENTLPSQPVTMVGIWL